jgi:hypothetical protein
MTLPHFLCIGVPKAGTTWLYNNLRQHPRIWLPPLKEIHYFDRPARPYLLDLFHPRYHERYRLRRWLGPAMRGLRSQPHDLGWYMRFFLGYRTPSWYRSLFTPRPNQIAGDITPTYCILPDERIARVAHLLPGARVILILRDPVERIWSHAAMYFSRYGQRGLRNATRAEIAAFIDRPQVRLRSDYTTILSRWQRHFPPAQWHIALHEDLAADPTGFLHAICRFLNVEPITPPAVGERVHAGSYPPVPAWVRERLEHLRMPALQPRGPGKPPVGGYTPCAIR